MELLNMCSSVVLNVLFYCNNLVMLNCVIWWSAW